MDWKEQDNRLCASFKFTNFTEAFAFMTEVAFAAEKQNHHPNWKNVWNVVDIELTTHEAGNTITEKDRILSLEISNLYQKYEQSM